MAILVLIGIALWIAMGLIGSGFEFAYFQSRWPNIAKETYDDDLEDAIRMGVIFGPIFMFVALIETGLGHYGWRLR